MVKVTTQDGIQMELNTVLANQCILIKNLIEDLGDESNELDIPLQNVSSETMTKVIEYLNYKQETEYDKKDVTEDLKFFDYVKMDDIAERDKLFQVILAANYLDNESLLSLGCKKVAEYIKGKPIEEIKEIFGYTQ